MVSHLVEVWGSQEVGESGYSYVGAVVGATYPDELRKLREVMPSSIFLVPGYGAQGGSAKDVAAAFGEDGFGALINSSRGINYAYEESDHGAEGYDKAAREAVEKMNEDLNSVRLD
jgi:orotidine-5'-phosphate decarboxylase